MAKGCYVGPISTIKIDDTNISDHFEVTNSTYGFEWTTVNGSKCLAPTNYGVNSSTATMTLKLKHNVDHLAMGYTCNTEQNGDKVTLKIGSTYALNGASGTLNNSYTSDALTAGTIITFSYSRNNLDYEGDESVLFKNLAIQSDRVAHKVKNIYVGVPTTIPIYETVTTPVTIDVDNINDFFEVTNSTYYFEGSDTVFAANNLGVNSTTATTTLKLKQDVTNLSFQYNYITETNYDKFTIKIGSTTVLNAVSGTNMATYNAGDLTAGTILTFSYSKDSSQSASGEACYFTSMTFTTEMTTQTGTETKSVARKIKKGYVGVGGVARPCWGGGGTLTSYGAITSLSYTRETFAATTVGNYALFGGGYNGTRKSTVDTYTNNLTHSTATSLNTARSSLAATTVGNYALFGGGATAGSTYSSTVDTYTNNLTHSTATSLSTARKQLAATTVGNYALFGGGYDGAYSSDVDAYNANLTHSTASSLNSTRCILAATTVGNYALFGGGTTASDSYSSDVAAYNTSLTRTIPFPLSYSRYRLSATTVGNYALFGGGYNGSTYYDVVDVYDESLTRSTATALAIGRYLPGAVTIGDYALFGGGYNGSLEDDVDVYDSSLTKRSTKFLSVGRYEPASTTVGDYALFAGGHGDSSVSTYSKVVDAFTVV